MFFWRAIPPKILPESFRIVDEVGPIFGAEYAMNQVAGMGVRHVATINRRFADGGDRQHIAMFASVVLRFWTDSAPTPNSGTTQARRGGRKMIAHGFAGPPQAAPLLRGLGWLNRGWREGGI